MCIHSLSRSIFSSVQEEPSHYPTEKRERGLIARTSNGSLVLLWHDLNGGCDRVDLLVIESRDKATPVGMRAFYQNFMGHVLCGGSDADHQDECKLHPLDLKDGQEYSVSKRGNQSVRKAWRVADENAAAAAAEKAEADAKEAATKAEHHDALDYLIREAGADVIQSTLRASVTDKTAADAVPVMMAAPVELVAR